MVPHRGVLFFEKPRWGDQELRKMDEKKLYIGKKGSETNQIRCGKHMEKWTEQAEVGPIHEGKWFNGCEECDEIAINKILSR